MNESIQVASETLDTETRMAVEFKGKIALLTNFLPPYRIRVLELLNASAQSLRIFLSVQMECNRKWHADWGALDVIVQKTISFKARASRRDPFKETREIHFPYNTLPQLRSYRPDVIIAAEFGMRTFQAAVYTWLFPETKLIVWATVSMITERNRGNLRKLIRRLILRFTDFVLVNGSSGAAYIESLGYKRERIRIVPQATDNDLFKGPPSRPIDRVCKLLFAGQLIERKGLVQFHEQLVKWCLLHPEREVSWTLIGSGPMADIARGWERPANYALHLIEEVPYRELPTHYRLADIFAFPTLEDEWGLVVNEAMIAGLPVLGSVYSQAVEDLVIDQESGWRFRPDNPAELYNALDRALNCGAENWNAMRQKAVETVKPIDSAHMKDLILKAVEDACSCSENRSA
jgi:glycosyltransferase involved in cell wall biosynthesis